MRVEPAGQRLQLVPGLRTSIRWPSSPAPIRAAPSWSARMGVTMRRASSRLTTIESATPSTARTPVRADRSVQAREGLLRRLLHEDIHRRAGTDRRRREHLSPGHVARHDDTASPRSGSRGSVRRRHLGQPEEVGLLEHQADVGVGDELALRRRPRRPGPAWPALIWETTSQMNFKFTSATSPRRAPPARATVM